MSLTTLIPANLRDVLRPHWHQLQRISSHSLINRIRWYLNKPPQSVNADGSVNLHLGCGAVNHPAFINVDLVPYSHVHHLRSIDDLSIFATESVNLIYASHCLEHFPFRKITPVLSEWARVLRKGGTIRLSVPDFDAIIDIYQASGRKLEKVLQAVIGGQNDDYNFHYVVFNKAYLTAQLEAAGFAEVREWVPGLTALTTFDDWSGKAFTVDGRPFLISLNLEATKA